MRQLRAPLRLFPAGLALGFGLWELLRLTPLATRWWFELPDIFALWLLAPLLLLALLAGLFASRRALLWLLLPLAIVGYQYGPLFLQHAPPVEGRPIRVMTANLLVESDSFRWLLRAIEQEQPDILLLQELNHEVADGLTRTQRGRFPYQELFPEYHPFGLGLLSRYPILRGGQREQGPESCSCQQVTLDLAGRPIVLVNAHLYPPRIGQRAPADRLPLPITYDPSTTRAMLRSLLTRVDAAPRPLLLAGDLNTSDRQSGYRLLAERLIDAHREAGYGFGFTFPVGPARQVGQPSLELFPAVRIDYLWHDPTWSARATWSGHLPSSDHRYVSADLILR